MHHSGTAWVEPYSRLSNALLSSGERELCVAVRA
jgi:hypothetical protein